VRIKLALCLLAALCHGGESGGGAAGAAVFVKAADNGKAAEHRMLTPGAVVSDAVSVGETRVYALDLRAGERAVVRVIKGDLQVKVSVCAQPDGACLESVGRRYGSLEVSFSADASARYKIEVRSLETDAAARSYELRLIAVADATPRHRMEDAAVRAAAEADGLRDRQDLSSLLAAASKYGEAQRSWGAAGELSRAAGALCDIGDIYFSIGRYPEAAAHYAKALSLSERSGDDLARLAALNGAGYVSISVGEKKKAQAHAQEMLAIVERADAAERDAADYRRAKARALNIMGEVYYSLGELRKSVEMFDLALVLWTNVGERSGQALAFLNLGYSYSDLGNPQTAAEHFQRSLAIFQSVNDGRGTALAQTALGGTYSTLGEEQLALNLHKQAVQHFRAIGDKQGAAAALNGVASAYLDLNEYQGAFDNYSEALQLYEEVGNRDFTALNKFLVGRVLYQRGEAERAFTYYSESLGLSRAVGDPVIEAHALKGLGTVYFSRGDVKHALAQFDAALQIYRRVGNRRSHAYALNDIGHVYASSGDVRRALASYAEALPIMREISDRRGEALTLFNTAKAELDDGNLTAARALVENSIAISESLRTKIKNSQLRTSYFASVHEQYELYIHVLMRLHAQQPGKGFDAVALVASERARARSLLDSLFEDKIRLKEGLSTDLLQREQELLRRLDQKAESQARLLSRKQSGAEAEQVAQEIRALTIEYQDARAKLREQNPRLATLTQPDQRRAEEIQNGIKDDDTLLLEFALGDERSYLWVVSADEIASYELPTRTTIEALSRRTYELLTARQSMAERPTPADEERLRAADAEYWRQSATLSTMLLGPAARRLGSKRLLIVSDGFLKYIPFEALPVPNQTPALGGGAELELLFFNHEIVGLPSALTLTALRSEQHPVDDATRTIAVIADPVFERDDPRVTATPPAAGVPAEDADDEGHLSRALRDFGGQGDSLTVSRLPSTLREAKAIMAVTPPGEGMEAIGFAATKERVVSGGLKDYRIIHFATHGLLNNESPELSGVILSLVDEGGKRREGFLRLHDIYDMELSADLVVLSACRTGLGRNVQGEGVVGLTSGFMYAGAKSVIASLWKVDDDATAELMSHFYSALLKDRLSPSAALKKAKREMWRQEHWRAPFYWAAFTLQGEYMKQLRVRRPPSLARVLIIGAVLAAALAGLHTAAVRYRRGARPR
jgi:CHAT domain-containing protein/predicted negative regulator of RcsB-dependent stress response